MRWVVIPIGKNIDLEIDEMARTVMASSIMWLACVRSKRSRTPSKSARARAKLLLHARGCGRNGLSGAGSRTMRARECLQQQLMSLETHATERLRRDILELGQMSGGMCAMQQSTEEDVNSTGRLVGVDVRCLDLQHGRAGSNKWLEIDYGMGGRDASAAPWGSSQVQWDQVPKNFGDVDHELPDQPGVIQMGKLLQVVKKSLFRTPREGVRYDGLRSRPRWRWNHQS